MDRIIATSVERNIRNVVNGDRLQLDPAEYRRVTYVNDAGAVHEIVVDVEHVVTDATDILSWFNHTRTAVEHLFAPNVPGDRTNADKVLAHASEQVGHAQDNQPATTGGGY